MANEHSIRVSAKGEFGQLNRGLKQLQGDLKGVLGEIDKGARKGGIFDDTSLRALDVYRNRFKGTLEELNKEFEKQNDIVDKLHGKMKTAYRTEKEELRKQIDLREKEMDVIRRQLFEVEKLYKKRNQEASNYGSAPAQTTSTVAKDTSGGSIVGGLLGNGMLAKLIGGGKMLAGMAGLAGIGALAHQAYAGALESRTMPMDLAQRIRGQEGWNGNSYDMWNRGYGIGTRDKMGYSASETWQFHDMYSRQAGALSDGDMEHLLKFGRAYGLNTSEVAGNMGGMRELGGTMSPAHFADLIAGSVEKSGMQPRILEVMETSAGLLANMNTTLKDTGAKQILAYQTTLDTIGNANGMMALTGKQGANIISGLGGIYDPQNEQWKYMGMQALQRYNPDKYGSMGLYGLESSFEDGLLNNDNMPAMVQYLREKSGGNENLMKRMLQKWLQAGGYNATKTQVNELYGVTNGMTAFSEENMKKVRSTLDGGDATAPYSERAIEIGQEILDVNARFEKQLEQLGQPLLTLVTDIKGGITKGLEWFNGNEDVQATLQSILDFMGEHWKTLATVGSIVLLGGMMLKGLSLVGTLIGGLGGVTGKGFGLLNGTMLKNLGVLGLLAGGVLGAKWMSDTIRQNRAEKIEGMKEHYKEGFGLSSEELEKSMSDNGISWANLEAGIADPKVAKWVDGLNKDKQKKLGIIDENGKRRTDAEWSEWANTPNNKSKFTKQEKDEFTNYVKSLEGKGDINLSELNDSGKKNFESLLLSGDTNFEDFLTSSEFTFGEFYDMSDENFTKLMKEGTNSLSSLYSDGKEYLSGVFDEHKGFKGFFASLWQDFTTQMSKIMGGGSFGFDFLGGGGSNYDVRNNSGVSAGQLNSKLGGKLAGMGQQFINAGNQYGIDPAFLASVAMHETGNGTSNAIKSKNNVGGMMGKNGLMSFSSIGSGISAMASNLKRLYIDQGLYTVSDIQKKYAPEGASNDPTGLNSFWTSGVSNYLAGFGVGGGNYATSGKSIFSNWKDHITSRYGDTEGRNHVHEGLDLKGNQGDYLEALVGGTISKIFHDDGSILDKDGKANSTAGGNTVMVKMADGTSYAYAHLSNINSQLREGQKISAGTYIGNVGGAKGVAGSGYSTTGSHLHLGYFDKNGKSMNPENLLNMIDRGMYGMNGKGDLDLSEMYSSKASSLDLTNRSLGDVMRNAIGVAPANSKNGAVSTINVNLRIEGGGAKELNKATTSELTKLVKQIVAQNEAQRLAMNPTVGGWA